jgi:hypothetical protein
MSVLFMYKSRAFCVPYYYRPSTATQGVEENKKIKKLQEGE